MSHRERHDGPQECPLGLNISRFDERQRRQRLVLPQAAGCWDYAPLIDLVVCEPGTTMFRFAGRTVAEHLATRIFKFVRKIFILLPFRSSTTQPLAKQVLAHAAGLPEGTPLVAKELLHLRNRAAVDQVLSRLVQRGALLRAGRGIYVLPTWMAQEVSALVPHG